MGFSFNERISGIRESTAHSITRVHEDCFKQSHFDAGKLSAAILKAGRATGEFSEMMAHRLTMMILAKARLKYRNRPPTSLEINRIANEVLCTTPFKQTATFFRLYRNEHSRIHEIVESSDHNTALQNNQGLSI
jgi:ribonucleoside-triphosphate reductase